MGVLAGEVLDGVGTDAGRFFPVGIQRMTGQIQAADLFFLLEQLGVTVLRQLADLIAVLLCGILLSPAHH